MMMADILIVSMGAFAKGLGTEISVIEIIFYKSIIALGVITAWLLLTKQWHLFKTNSFKAQAMRAILGNANACLLFWSYTLLPLGMAATFFYTSPIFVLLQSILFLKERVGIYRWGAVLTGFLGIAFITQPAFNGAVEEISLFAIFIGLIPAIGAAGVHVSIRYLATIGEPATTTVFYFSLIGTILSGAILIFHGLSWPLGLEILILGLGLSGVISQILKTVAYKYAEASVVAPFRYVGLIFSMIIGFIFWDEIPTLAMIAGAAIIIVSNLVIIWREAVKKKRDMNSEIVI